jgi:hypothetical protein
MQSVISRLANGEPKYAHDPLLPGWQHCYYFLYEYEVKVSPTGTAPLPYATSENVAKNTQEHILPQEHRDGDWWESEWPDRAEADQYKHRLGNLVLTSNNNALGRKRIALKLTAPAPEYCYTHINATNSEKRIANFTSGDHWRPTHILKRELEMVRVASERWSIPCVNDGGTFSLPIEFRREIGVESIDVNHPVYVDAPDIVGPSSQVQSGDDAEDVELLASDDDEM